MTITLLLFASCRESVGRSTVTLEMAPGSCVGDLRRQLPGELPSLAGIAPSISIAVNEEYAKEDVRLHDGDEVALIPPVSGGSQAPIVVSEETIASDSHAWVAQTTDGAVVRFEGIVRDNARERPTNHLEYEAYVPMAQKVLGTICEEARQHWPVGQIAISHRVGRLEIGEISVLITVGSPHRDEAFSACRFVIDRIKEVVPIWKKEVGPDGSFWVEGPHEPPSDRQA